MLISLQEIKVGTSEWKSIYNAEKDKYDGYNKAYAIKSASEYFAESYKDYKEHPSALRSKRPRTYQFVKSTIDGITDSDVQNIKDTYGEYWGIIGRYLKEYFLRKYSFFLPIACVAL